MPEIFHSVFTFVVSLLLSLGVYGRTLPAYASTPPHFIQYISGKHVLGFTSEGVYVASGDHSLKIDFMESKGVEPTTETPPTSSSLFSQKGTLSLGTVTYKEVWDGVDIQYVRSISGIAKSTYTLTPINGSVPIHSVKLHYNRPVTLDPQGNLTIPFDSGSMTESAPIAWQEKDGERYPVQVSFLLSQDQTVGFTLGSYLPDLPITIDPELTWNTFLGGSGDDYGQSIALDASAIFL